MKKSFTQETGLGEGIWFGQTLMSALQSMDYLFHYSVFISRIISYECQELKSKSPDGNRPGFEHSI